ncbi:MAG: PTS system mannose/fructose/sorbose family transporter subunit IID [Candidatus Eisenbacteria bacterium]
MGTLTRAERAGMFWRSLFLQAAWNPRGMQNVGFCFAILPVFARCGRSKEARRAFLRRHLGFFNTNPTLASYVLGAAAAAEVAGADESAVVSLKKGLSSPLGMAGDAFLWGALRPLAATLAVLLALRGIVWAPLVLVGVYSVPHLALKARGVGVGAAAGPAGAREVLGPGLKGAVRWTRALAAFGVGLILAGAVTRGDGTAEPWRLLMMVLFVALAYAASRVRIPAMLVALGGAAGGVVLLLAGLNGG